MKKIWTKLADWTLDTVWLFMVVYVHVVFAFLWIFGLLDDKDHVTRARS